jgi:colanic acid biosynthesis glycosyl transferase WcaI
MHILIVTQYFWPEHFRINEISEEFTSRGHCVTVLTGIPNYPDGEIFPEFRASRESYASYHGAEIVRVPMVPRGKRRLGLALNYLSFAISGCLIGGWKLRGRTFDAIFVFQMSPITLAIPAMLQRALKRRPLAMWITDLWPESLVAVGVLRSPPILAAFGKFVSFIYHRCDCILVQSKAFVASVESHGIDRERIVYFPAWAEGAFEANISTTSVSPILKPYQDGFNIMFAGNIGDAQDMSTVLAAATALRHRRDIRWLFVGEGRATEYCRQVIAREKLDGTVILLGRHPVEAMPSFFAGADAMLVSLKRDPVFALTIPGKVQSYLRAGKPIIAMLEGEGARIVSEAKAGFTVPPGDAKKLAQTVLKMSDIGKKALFEMGKNARAYGELEFDRFTLLSRLEGILENLAAKWPRSKSTRH